MCKIAYREHISGDVGCVGYVCLFEAQCRR